METLTKTDQKMNVQTLPLIIPSEDLKKGKKFIRNSHRTKYLIKFYYVISTGVTLAIINDEYARFLGYRNKVDMLTFSNQLDNINRELVHDAEQDGIYILQPVPRNSYKSN